MRSETPNPVENALPAAGAEPHSDQAKPHNPLHSFSKAHCNHQNEHHKTGSESHHMNYNPPQVPILVIIINLPTK